MELTNWLKNFRQLHEKARKNALSERERETYLAGRNELARAILASQKMTLLSGQTPRQALRAARVLPIELEIQGRPRPHLTMEVSTGGFSAILAEAPSADKRIPFSLKLPSGHEPITGEAVCVQTTLQPGRCRCCFRFEALSEANREQIELFVFDALLEHLKT